MSKLALIESGASLISERTTDLRNLVMPGKLEHTALTQAYVDLTWDAVGATADLQSAEAKRVQESNAGFPDALRFSGLLISISAHNMTLNIDFSVERY